MLLFSATLKIIAGKEIANTKSIFNSFLIDPPPFNNLLFLSEFTITIP